MAAQPDGANAAQIGTRLQEAERAARLALANERIERTEALVLTRSTIAGTETIPMREGAVASLVKARQALGMRDLAAAISAIAKANSMTRGM